MHKIPTFLETPEGINLYKNPATRSEYDNICDPLINADGVSLTTSLLKRFDQVMLLKVLNHILRPLSVSTQGNGMIKRLEVIYILLTGLEMPMHRDTSSMIRNMARQLCEVRGRGEEVEGCDVILSVCVGLGQVGIDEVF